MKQSKKWIALALVCSQFLSTIPASAALVGPEDTIESTPTEEQSPAIPEDQESQPSEPPEETPTEPVNPPVEEGPAVPEVPEETPEEPTPALKPEDPAPVDPPKEEAKPAPTPKPDQSTNQEATPETVQPAPVENQRPTLPELAESTPTEANQSTAIEITPVKETWDFIKEIGEDARKIGLEEDLYGSVMIAQAILESASGQSKLSQAPYHNLFGIKGRYEGKGVTFKTQEDDGLGNLYTIDATFRQYEDYEATFKDYAKLLKEGLAHDNDFYKGTWKSETVSYEDATEFLTGRYATDTQYGEKLNALIEAYALTSYDKEQSELPEGTHEMSHPVTNPVVSSSFGPRGSGFHRGADFSAPLGTPIFASLAGTVIRSEYHVSWGNYIAIEHEDGLTTLYAHNNQNLVTVGQTVEQGEIIASMGSTGNSTGPHLHFEVSLSPRLAQDQLIDPMTVLP
ncbi:N-acetylmuramoyl-L-alanine amidase [Enterococcus sp. C1]|uniref:peptidoglycan DD-metalloendopeptidase family protein n=1 Tax=Enterococcus sp. C1 TaxID=1182762 RepID=UPI0002721933|nr:peptidoglycan DD-metalloendopeptidase family protein [Enterococcus sp. C1]EJF48095.1 N-acetylmuramoyl-L-alanine amidase [Enterococcus sp. C1]